MIETENFLKQTEFEFGFHEAATILDRTRIEQEYAILSSQPNAPECSDVKTATCQENLYKNRYLDVYAHESRRVKLIAKDSCGQDYINASFIDGEVPGSENAYILTQAPLPHTFDDFWQMIWEQCVPVIVMLTRFFEGSRIKADKYWPEEGECLLYRFIRVSVLSVENDAKNNLSTRKLLLSRRNSQTGLFDERIVYHFHYTGWPDFGVPENTQEMINLILNASHYSSVSSSSSSSSPSNLNYNQNPSFPIVIHCSAGLGRAGTFAALHISLQRWLHGLPIDILTTVQNLRRQRANLIQTLQQYQFVYATLGDALAQQ